MKESVICSPYLDIPIAPKMIRTATGAIDDIDGDPLSTNRADTLRLSGAEEQSSNDSTTSHKPGAIRVRSNLINIAPKPSLPKTNQPIVISAPSTLVGGSLEGVLRTAEAMFDETSAAAAKRPTSFDLGLEVSRLKEEVRALQWLARRKEQEWDQTVRLLKQKEEKLLKADRAKMLAGAEAKEMANILVNSTVPMAKTKTVANGTTATIVSSVNAAPIVSSAGGSVLINGRNAVPTMVNGQKRYLISAGAITPAQLQAIKQGTMGFGNNQQECSMTWPRIKANALSSIPLNYKLH
jgi:hypothetical protein